MQLIQHRALIAAVLAALLFTNAACTDSDPASPQEPTSESLLPLAVGNTWVYEYTSDFHGIVPDYLMEIKQSIRTQALTPSRERAGAMDFFIGNAPSPANAPFSYYFYSKGTDRIIFGRSAGGFGSTDTIQIGYELLENPPISAARTDAYWVAAKENVTVPAGTFTDCLLLRYQSVPTSTYIVDKWFKRGVGIVKVVEKSEGKTTRIWLLKSYTLK